MGQAGAPGTGYNWTAIQLRGSNIQIGPYTYTNTAGLQLSPFVANQWYHVAFTNSAGTANVNTASIMIGYVNGVQRNTAYYTRYAPTTSYYCLGGPGNANFGYLHGSIGYLKIYNSVLTAARIRENYNLLCERYGLSIIPPDAFPQPMFYLDANINFGTTTWDITTTLTGTPTYASANGGTVSFNSTTQWAQAPTGFANFATGMTIFIIANFGSTANTWERLIDFGNGASSDNFLVSRYSNSTTQWTFQVFQTATGSTHCIGTLPTANTNAAYTVVLSGNAGTGTGSVTVYTNNGSAASYTNILCPNTINRTSNFIAKSNWVGDSLLEGTISVIQIYNQVLTTSQLTTLYNRYKTRFSLP